MFDVCISGGGVSGLVFALRFREKYPTTTVAICEKNNYLGGRLLMERFHGFRVPHGGSMVRGGDKRVMNLCTELGLKIISVDKSSYLSSEEETFNNRMVDAIKERSIKYKSREDYGELTVGEFLDREFSPKDRDKFIKYAIYRDFLSSSLKEFMDYYPPDDLYQPEGREEGLYIVKGGYGALVDNLVKRVREDKNIRIYLETKVKEVEFMDEKTWTVKTSGGDLNTSLVIWATDWSGRKALPNYPRHLVEEYIAPVPFFRAAAYSTEKIKEGLITGGDLGKVFPLMKNVFQLAYTETESAERLNQLTRGRSREEIIKVLQPLFDKEYLTKTKSERVEIEDVIIKYWKAGIHQYIKSPSDNTMEEIQKPFFGFYMIGEMVVRDNKGWVEGALQSVEEFFNRRSFQTLPK